MHLLGAPSPLLLGASRGRAGRASPALPALPASPAPPAAGGPRACPTAPHIRSQPRAWLDWRSLLTPHKAPTYTRSLPAKVLPIAEPTSLLLYSHVTTRPHGSALSTSILLLPCSLAASSVAAASAASAAPLPATSALRPSPLQHPLRHRQAPICIHMQCHALVQGQKLGCSWPAPSVKSTTPWITQSPIVAKSRRRLRDRSCGTRNT
jgi:hypothetical protein